MIFYRHVVTRTFCLIISGISWARHSWSHGTDIILADEMVRKRRH